MRISDWSSDVCSSDLARTLGRSDACCRRRYRLRPAPRRRGGLGDPPLFPCAPRARDQTRRIAGTLADRAAEQAMRALIEAERPQDGIVGEEFGVRAGTSGRQWVLDPIDGTRAFISGRPIFGTLIALVVERWPMIGVIDQPIARERWTRSEEHTSELQSLMRI